MDQLLKEAFECIDAGFFSGDSFHDVDILDEIEGTWKDGSERLRVSECFLWMVTNKPIIKH